MHGKKVFEITSSLQDIMSFNMVKKIDSQARKYDTTQL